MKQHITVKQWKQVCKEGDKLIISDLVGFKKQKTPFHPDIEEEELCFNDMNIGQMIEFLGDDLIIIENNNGFWEKKVFSVTIIIGDTRITFDRNELCDALWSACKYKLK